MSTNLTMIRGNTTNIHLRLAPVQIESSDQIYFTAKPSYDEDENDNSAVIRKDITGIVSNSQGVASFVLTPLETDIPPGKYVYDITIEFGSERRTTLLGGKLTIKPVATLRGIK